jgi:DNA-binding HxlR family transcriptional regulator
MPLDETSRSKESLARKPGRASVAEMVEEILGCKWSVMLLSLLAQGPQRPSHMLKTCKGLSPKVLNERLQKMMAFGILHRTAFGEKPPLRVEYSLTAFGSRFLRVLNEVRRLQEELDRIPM